MVKFMHKYVPVDKYIQDFMFTVKCCALSCWLNKVLKRNLLVKNLEYRESEIEF